MTGVVLIGDMLDDDSYLDSATQEMAALYASVNPPRGQPACVLWRSAS
jgi:hypothetical protein